MCGSTYEFGTDEPDFERVLRYMLRGVASVRKRKRPGLGLLDEHLTGSDRAAVVLYWAPARGYHPKKNRGAIGGHYALILGLDRCDVTAVNDDETLTVSRKPRATLGKKLAFNRRSKDFIPQVWLLRLL